MSTQLGNMSVGSIVKIRESDVLRNYIVVHQPGDANPSVAYQGFENTTILMRERALPNRRMNGTNVNDYQNSEIAGWLNGEFLNSIDADIRNQIRQVRIPFRPGSGTSPNVNIGASGLLTRIFLPSLTEVGFTTGQIASQPNAEGIRFAFFPDALIGQVNDALIAKNDEDPSVNWWLRSPSLISSNEFWRIPDIGGGAPGNASSSSRGSRPVFALLSSHPISTSGEVRALQPPAAPSSISVPTNIVAGTVITVSWGAATDPQGFGLTYILQRQIDGGAWTQVSFSMGLSSTNFIAPGTTTVAFRVRARNIADLDGPYRTSPTRTVTQPSPPPPPTIRPPITPLSINVPTNILGGGNVTVSWGASTDPQGQAITYILQRQIDSGAWTQIFSGSGLSTIDNIPAGTTTVTFRVSARNTSGLASGHQTSPTRNVINNRPPSVNGTDVNLGVQTGAFTHNYVVTDPDAGDTLTVIERINGVQLRQFTATNGATNTLTISQQDFLALANGTNTLTITVSDQLGLSAVRTLTFSRSETQIEILLERPRPANDRPTRAVITVNRQIPTGAVLGVEICNNAYDNNPTWEDCTQSVLDMGIYRLQNTTNTAGRWGVNIRVRANRNGATGLCWISSIGGAFDNI